MKSLKPLNNICSKDIITDAVYNSVKVDRIATHTPRRAIHRTPGVNIDVFSTSCGSNSSFAKWSRKIERLNNSVDRSAAQERDSNYFCIGKMGVEILPSKIATDSDPNKRGNLVSSILSESPRFINFGLQSFNATDEPNIAFTPSSREKMLNGTER